MYNSTKQVYLISKGILKLYNTFCFWMAKFIFLSILKSFLGSSFSIFLGIFSDSNLRTLQIICEIMLLQMFSFFYFF